MVKEIDENHFELKEKCKNGNNEVIKIKLDIVKNQQNIDWTVYAFADGIWEKLRTLNLKKKK